jgi:TolB-like protein
MYCEHFRPSRVGHHAWVLVFAVLVATPNPGIAAERIPKLLLLPIVVHSSEDPGYVRNGLGDMLRSRFSRIGGLDLVRPEDPIQGTTDRAKALELARTAGADFVLYGSFTRFGQGASLDVQCLPTDESKRRAPLREIFVHSGSIGEIIPDLDDLAGKVSRFVRGENVSTAPAAQAGSAPAASPDLQELIDRIEALEAAITQILEEEVDIEMDIDESAE